MNLDIERTEKNSQRVRSGQVIIGVFWGELLDWVGLGWVWAMVAFYLLGRMELLYCTRLKREKFAGAYIPT